MPTEIVSQLPGLASLIERAGIVGVLLIVIGWLVYERLRLIKLNAKTFRQRDMSRMVAERYRTFIVAAGNAAPDIRDIEDMFRKDLEE